MKEHKNIGIIGCGVSGLTVANLLIQNGYSVTLYSKYSPLINANDPTFASQYPAASIIPHSVFGHTVGSLFKYSQSYFEQLYLQDFPGLSKNKHFELFGYEQRDPWYKEFMPNFTAFNELNSEFHPRHPKIKVESGWCFECFFADWPVYFSALYHSVFAHQDKTELKIMTLSNKDLQTLPHDILINCGGLSAANLFDDSETMIYKGHLVTVKGAPPLESENGQTISYNFSPGAKYYSTTKNETQDIYCYSRNNEWVFGGSRIKGFVQNQNQWVGDSISNSFVEIDGIQIPSQILDLNSEIIAHTFGIDTRKYLNRKAKLGYRFIRNEQDGLRIDHEELHGKKIIHNYGHGGAGVTLSWGCAKKVVDLLHS
jgi:glycine/D-amino acid oxidase-like deaminating enzyme